MNIAVQSLGLSDVGDFNPEDKVLGMPKINGELANRITFDFVDEVSRDSPAPGGGSVAALSGALGAALGTMVANLSTSKAGFEDKKEKLAEISYRMKQNLNNHITMKMNLMATIVSKLELLNPQSQLQRGYALAVDKDQKVIYTSEQVEIDDVIQLRIARGKLSAKVLDK